MAHVSRQGSGDSGCAEPARPVLRDSANAGRTIPAAGQRRHQHQVLVSHAKAHGPWFHTQIPIIYIQLLLIGLSLALSVLFFGTRVANARSNGTQNLLL